jgi:hypothetical protein
MKDTEHDGLPECECCRRWDETGEGEGCSIVAIPLSIRLSDGMRPKVDGKRECRAWEGRE